MNIDERLERLTERHEALGQSLELLTHDVAENTKQIGQIMEAVSSLVHVAEIHEARLTRLEGGEV